MKTLVVYYSRTGNNTYLAKMMTQALQADLEAVTPRLNVFPALVLFSAIKLSPGIKPLTHRVADYDAVVVCGPVWMGQLISPLRDVLKTYHPHIKRLYFATCCGGSDSQKDDKFGYASVFRQVRQLTGDTCAHCEAFPIGLALPEAQQADSDAMMKARLSDQNFTGQLQERLQAFVRTVMEG